MLQNIDINKMNRLMEENSDFKEIIQQLLKNHQETVSMIGHEIRNPLTLISSSLQIMEMKYPETKSFSGWAQLTDDVNYLSLLLNELSQFNNGRALNPDIFSMEILLRNIVVSFAMMLEKNAPDVMFTSLIPSTLGLYTGDKIKLSEVILNLLQNAYEALDGCGSIHLRAIRRNTALIIQIKDNGCGIPQEYVESIFDPFVTHKPKGTGLGLAISKRIVEAHGGTISVESDIQGGSVFSIHLPV